MKKVTEQIGKTVEEAIRKGLEELKVSRDDVKIEVLEEPSSGGVLGILSAKMARVRLTVDKKISDEQANATKAKLEEILSNMFKITKEDFEYTIEKRNNQLLLTINGDNVAHLIGYKGKTIESFQSLLNSMLQREDEEYAKVFVEINDYKKKKEEKLKRLANKMADNVIRFRRPIKLEPMSAYERLIIHTELANRKDVETESIGEEPRRRVVIKKKYS
ncbi:MAG: RNA-binding cell elongation regulator Jag/EloR [Clostridia bacterium]|nr:RNA-binding cell elongation regulator Jag/EloR [Clostridia bacterium]